MQVKTICLHAVELAVPSDFGLALVKVALRPGFTVELLYFRRGSIEKVAVVCLLVAGCKAAKN